MISYFFSFTNLFSDSSLWKMSVKLLVRKPFIDQFPSSFQIEQRYIYSLRKFASLLLQVKTNKLLCSSRYQKLSVVTKRYNL